MKCDTQTHVTLRHLSREWLWISVPMQMYLWAAWCLRAVPLEICVFAILFVYLLQTAAERHQPGSGVLQSHIQSWPPWGMASGISCVCACWRGGRRGRGPVGMRKRRPNMGLTSPAGPFGEWKAITKGPIPQLITVCYLPELTSKKNWNYRDGKAVLPSLKGSRFSELWEQ